MNPLNIYLVRHGETEANVDRALYRDKADHAIRLTDKGIEEAERAGAFLSERLCEQAQREGAAFGKIRLWHSAYYRARETALHILRPLGRHIYSGPPSDLLTYREEPFLIEQKAGLFDGIDDGQFAELFPDSARDLDKHLRYNGRAYAITPQGESRLDVVIRVKHVFGTILDDYRTHGIRHVVLVCHGVTARAFAMGFMRYPPEWLDAERNPGNCWVRHIHGTRDAGYVDAGYIHGDGAPIGDPMAIQRRLENSEEIFMLKLLRAAAIVPPGIAVMDPFAPEKD